MGAEQPTGPARLRGGQLGVRDVWALGVGIVVCGQYFGWNLGLKGNGPVAMLVASLAVCLLFLAWVLTLSELTVAMPRAGGPLDHGRRAAGPWLGFLMGWSMYLECLFAGVATALAAGKYVAFLVDPSAPDRHLAVAVGLGVVVVFFVLQARGVKEQARALVLMTYAGLAGLAVFWVVALTNFSWDRVWTTPAVPAEKGWGAVLDAVPFALWWLIVIEAAVLAAEEARDPARTVPRGLTWAVLTVIGMVVLTTVTACGAARFDRIAERPSDAGPVSVDYPLAEVLRLTPAGGSDALFYGFGVVALVGLVASYHGLLFGSSRQLYALGRDGFLPAGLGAVNATRRTPVAALAATSLVTAGLVVANLWFEQAVAAAVLVAGFAALVLYLLTTATLVRLRLREPAFLAGYRAPLGWWLPLAVVVLSGVALAVYPRIDGSGVVVPVAVGTYLFGAACFALVGRPLRDDPRQPPAVTHAAWVVGWPHWLGVASLVLGVGAVGLVASAALGGPDLIGPPTDGAAVTALAIVAAAIVGVAAVELSRGKP